MEEIFSRTLIEVILSKNDTPTFDKTYEFSEFPANIKILNPKNTVIINNQADFDING